ncbi:hypothetical protein [Enterovirga sp. CN4-39]|uniref:hypothetical protein n=1 Tax=Enterovirga sp. CN4-39 TaxID=3400910 RepID=UPI003C080AB2
MMLGASFTSFAISLAGLVLFGSSMSSLGTEILGVLAVTSGFVAICSAEARFAS